MSTLSSPSKIVGSVLSGSGYSSPIRFSTHKNKLGTKEKVKRESNVTLATPTDRRKRRPRPLKFWEHCCIANYFCCDHYALKPAFYSRSNGPGCCLQLERSFFFYLTLFLLIVLNSLFVFTEWRFMVNRVTPYVLLITQVQFLFVFATLIVTACTDPGIIPPAHSYEAKQLESDLKLDTSNSETEQNPPLRTKDIMIHKQPLKIKYCYTCRFFRPPRTSHCSICDNCVDQFDHHCPWIGNCVGRRNYRVFYLFLLSLSSYGVIACACQICHIILAKKAGHDTILIVPTIVLLVVNLVSLWSVFGLAGFHTYLLLCDLTTNEDIKGVFVSRRIGRGDWLENPFTSGSAWTNCYTRMCAARKKSLLEYYPP